MSDIILGARDIGVSANQIGNSTFLLQDMLNQGLVTTQQRYNRDQHPWGGNDLGDPILSLKISRFPSPNLIPPYAHFHNPLEIRPSFKDLHVRIPFEQCSREEEQRTREGEFGRRKGQARMYCQAIHCGGQLRLKSLQDLLRNIHNAVQNSLSKGWGGEPLSASSLMPPDLLLSRVATWGVTPLHFQFCASQDGERTPGQRAEMGVAVEGRWCLATPVWSWLLQQHFVSLAEKMWGWEKRWHHLQGSSKPYEGMR